MTCIAWWLSAVPTVELHQLFVWHAFEHGVVTIVPFDSKPVVLRVHRHVYTVGDFLSPLFAVKFGVHLREIHSFILAKRTRSIKAPPNIAGFILVFNSFRFIRFYNCFECVVYMLSLGRTLCVLSRRHTWTR